MIELHLYMKSFKKPFTFVLEDKAKVNEFYQKLKSDDNILQVGPIIFNKANFIFATTIETKHKKRGMQ